MPIRISPNPEIAAFQLYSYLLADAILTDRRHALEVFSHLVEFYETGETRPIERVASISHDEYLGLCEFFPFSGISAAKEAGVFGTCIRFNGPGDLSVGIYANEDGERALGGMLNRLPRSDQFRLYAEPSGGFEFVQGPPLMGGASVGPINGIAEGTLGAWLKEANSDRYLGISNNHVLCEFNRFPRGTDIIHPAASGRGNPSNAIGTLEGFVRLWRHNNARRATTSNTADVAWCTPLDPSTVSRTIAGLNVLPTGECDIDYDLATFQTPVEVHGYGNQSGVMRGTVNALGITWLDDYYPSTTPPYFFMDQLEIQMNQPVAKGDSGTIILRKEDNRIGGIMFCRDKRFHNKAFASPWSQVLKCSSLVFDYR